MTAPVLPGIFSDVAPSRLTVQHIAQEARASGRRAVNLGQAMLAYRDALLAHGPATDAELAARLGWDRSSCCGRRGDWLAWSGEDRPCIVAVDRVRVGKATQARWRWVGER